MSSTAEKTWIKKWGFDHLGVSGDMRHYVTSDLNPEWEDQDIRIHPEGIIGVTQEDVEVDNISRNCHFPWQHPKRMSGRERYLALCKKLGLKPK